MDTGTHFVTGLGLAGLAHIDPVVAADPSVSTAILIGTVLGSQAPDADGLLRLKSNAAYIKNHRGRSHSLPAMALWTLLITLGLALFNRDLPLWHVGMWVGIAVCVHVLMDLFNSYGTQSLWPFSGKWISWNIIHIFDPVIFASHVVAVCLWVLNLAEPAFIFPALYVLLALYYVWRTVTHFVLQKNLPISDLEYQSGDKYYLIPTVHLKFWNVVKHKKDGSYRLGELRGGRLIWIDQVRSDRHPAIEASKALPDVQAFLYYSSFACAEARTYSWGYEVRWTDVRYRHRKHYPFLAVVLLDRHYKRLDSYVGWVSDSRLEKKLRGAVQ